MAAEPRVARVTEIIAGSPKGFEEAVKIGFARATKTLRGITGLRVVEMRVAVENSKITRIPCKNGGYLRPRNINLQSRGPILSHGFESLILR